MALLCSLVEACKWQLTEKGCNSEITLLLGSSECFTHTASDSVPGKQLKKSGEMPKKLSWLATGRKKRSSEDGVERNGIPQWICMVMQDSKDHSTCNDTRLSQSLDLSLLQKEGSNVAREDMGNSQTGQVSPHSKMSMMQRFRNRSHSIQPDNFLGVDKLMVRRKSDSTAHKFAVDGKGLTSRKSSVLSDNSTSTNQRGSQTSEASVLAPLSPYLTTRGYSVLKV